MNRHRVASMRTVSVNVLSALSLGFSTTSAAQSGPTDSVTFADHVAPILFARCIVCHNPSGSAPFSLLTYEDAVSRADRIVRATRRRFMPPWLPDSGLVEFAGARRLTAEEIAIIGRWVDSGTPRGDPAVVPPLPANAADWQLGEPDLVLSIPGFEIPAHDFDVYRNLVVAIPVTGTRYVRSTELRPGGTNFVHHARLMIDTTASSRFFDRQDPGPGFDGMDVISNAVNPDGFFVGWTPGKVPYQNKDGLAWRLEPGTDLVLQVHLPPSDTVQKVEPQIGLRFTESVPSRRPALVMLGSFDIDIPPGQRDYVVSDTYQLPVDVSVLGVYPHAHYLGKIIEGFATLPTGETRWLIRISNWDFNWQDEYHYVEPVDLPAGSMLTMRITYDNSAANPRNPNDPPKRVVYGSNSTDEMADLVVQVLPRRRADFDRLQRDLNLWHYTAVVTRIARAEHEQGLAAAADGRIDDAIEHFREAIANKFDEPQIHNDLGSALAMRGRTEEAAAHFREASRLAPEWAEPQAYLATTLLASLDSTNAPREALIHAQRAAELTERVDAEVLDLLARAYAANGRLGDAVRTAEAALRLAVAQSRDDLVQRIRNRLEQYRTPRDNPSIHSWGRDHIMDATCCVPTGNLQGGRGLYRTHGPQTMRRHMVMNIRHVALATTALMGCGDAPFESRGPPTIAQPGLQCRFVTEAVLTSGSSRDGIPALINPPLVPASHPDAQYVDAYAQNDPKVEARVVGLIVDGTPVAIPHNILWWHEIVNIDLGGRRLAISYCPLTGSAMVFDATAAGTQRFGVSGLIFQNNLVMFDEETGSLWPQMCARASVGDREGTELVNVPATEMLWQTWKDRYPETLVISSQTGWDRDYDRNPYDDYELSDILLFALPDSADMRRPMKERVLGIPGEDGGIAIPFGVLEALGSTVAIRTVIDGETVQILWDNEARAARAFFPRTTDGVDVRLQTEGSRFVDVESGSVFNVEGRAIDGPLEGAALVAHDGAFVAFWFAWSAFHVNTRLWTQE